MLRYIFQLTSTYIKNNTDLSDFIDKKVFFAVIVILLNLFNKIVN